MSNWARGLLTISVLYCAAVAGSESYPGIGRAATPAEVTAWDIDVRPDFLGLPAGSGSVSEGAKIFAAQCASCHGSAGELQGGAIMAPLIGGVTAADIASGQVQALVTTPEAPRTVFMKLATLSSLFDYIQRAMPWSSPKTLQPDEVYASVAYLLYLAGIVPKDFMLTKQNIVEVQAVLPNRNGMSSEHGLWPGASSADGGMGNGGVPDVKAIACMRDCAEQVGP